MLPPPAALALRAFLWKICLTPFFVCACSQQRKRQIWENASSVRRCQSLSLCLFLLSSYFSQQRLIALTPPPPRSRSTELADYHEAVAERPDACTLLQTQSRGSPAMTTGAGQMFSGACTSLNAERAILSSGPVQGFIIKHVNGVAHVGGRFCVAESSTAADLWQAQTEILTWADCRSGVDADIQDIKYSVPSNLQSPHDPQTGSRFGLDRHRSAKSVRPTAAAAWMEYAYWPKGELVL